MNHEKEKYLVSLEIKVFIFMLEQWESAMKILQDIQNVEKKGKRNISIAYIYDSLYLRLLI